MSEENDLIEKVEANKIENSQPSAETPEMDAVYEALGIANPQVPDIQQNVPQVDAQNNARCSTIEKVVAQDVQKVKKLVQLGLINPLQGQNLVNQVIKKAFDEVLQNGEVNSQSAESVRTNTQDGILEFCNENPLFFQQGSRDKILDYLKNSGVKIDKEEVSKITQLVEMIEESAVKKYLDKSAYDEKLNSLNELAKQKLTANAQNSGYGEKNVGVFTREQIGKMSGSEFTKYEKQIMEQLRNGLIR